jgi:hypothetical protein
MRKNTQEFIVSYFKEKGCELLDLYENNITPMKFICGRCKQISEITFSSFKRSSHCFKCSPSRKLTIEELKDKFKEANCELLDQQYCRSSKKMKVRCQCNNVFFISWNNFKKGKRCKKCWSKKAASLFKFSLEQVTKIFEENGCKLLSDSYINSQQVLDYICKCGRKSKIRYTNFRKGKRCRQCYADKIRSKHGDKKFIRKCRSILLNSLKQTGLKKTDSTFKLLGYDGEQLKQHITYHPNWEKVKNLSWQIDHIFPIKAFCDYNILDLKLINCLENLMPVTDTYNRRKSGKYNKDKFEKWLSSKGIIVIYSK